MVFKRTKSAVFEFFPNGTTCASVEGHAQRKRVLREAVEGRGQTIISNIFLLDSIMVNYW